MRGTEMNYSGMTNQMTNVSTASTSMEDALSHLPIGEILTLPPHTTLYSAGDLQPYLYLVISGQIKLTRHSPPRAPFLLDLTIEDEFFGEVAFTGAAATETARSMRHPVKLMVWKTFRILELALERPLLGIALMQMFVARTTGYADRVESLTSNSVSELVWDALWHFVAKFRTTSLPPLTHDLLSRYIGTSREIVTREMNVFRRAGLLTYSRKGIVLLITKDKFTSFKEA